MTAPLLDVRDLTVAHGRVEAVFGISIAVGAGAISTIIGPNGAGKSTALGALAGLLPSRGTVRLEGRSLDDDEVEDRVESGLVLVPERRELFTTMSVEHNLQLGAYRSRRLGRAHRAAALERIYETFPRLKERRQQLSGTLSGGERQMLAIGRALMSEPKLLMLDEPSLGLAPLIVQDILAQVVRLRGAGVSILLVEQNARAALEIADQAYVLEGGRITLSGPADTIAGDARVIDAYLGRRSAG